METIRKRSLAVRGFAQTLRLGGVFEGDGDRPVLAHDPVGVGLGFRGGAGIDVAFQVDGGTLGPHVEAGGFQSVARFENGREKVLAGVLLHVVEAPEPIDGAIDGAIRGGGLERRSKPVDNARFVLDDAHHRDAGECAGVAGLAAGRGVERGAVQPDGQAVVRERGDVRREPAQVAIGVVEAFGHGEILLYFDRSS